MAADIDDAAPFFPGLLRVFSKETMPTTPAAFSAQTPELALAALHQKSLARSNRTARNRRLALGVLGGVAAVFVFGYLLPARMSSGLDVLMVGTFVGAVVGFFWLNRLQQVLAVCPVCAHNWEIKEGRSVPSSEQMEAWDKCPGCGLLMADWALERAAKGLPRLVGVGTDAGDDQ